MNQDSKVWFTLSHGIVKEVYFLRGPSLHPRSGLHRHRRPGLLFEEKQHCTFENWHSRGSFTDPYRNVVLQKIRFERGLLRRGLQRQQALHLSPIIGCAIEGNFPALAGKSRVQQEDLEDRVYSLALCGLPYWGNKFARTRSKPRGILRRGRLKQEKQTRRNEAQSRITSLRPSCRYNPLAAITLRWRSSKPVPPPCSRR